jgi:hypothetical protein
MWQSTKFPKAHNQPSSVHTTASSVTGASGHQPHVTPPYSNVTDPILEHLGNFTALQIPDLASTI